LFIPNFKYNLNNTASSLAGDNASFGALTSATRLSGVKNYRIVSYGMKVKRVCAPLSSSGTVYIRGLSSITGAGLENQNMTSYYTDFHEDLALQDCKEVAVIGRRIGAEASFFHDIDVTTPTTALADWVSPGWGPITISVVGGPPSVGTLNIEYFVNMEVTFSDSESLGLLMTPSPVFDPRVVDSANKIASEAKSVFLNGAREAGSFVVRKATQALLSVAAARFGGPAAGARVLMLD
jgi:hypothetical protein